MGSNRCLPTHRRCVHKKKFQRSYLILGSKLRQNGTKLVLLDADGLTSCFCRMLQNYVPTSSRYDYFSFMPNRMYHFNKKYRGKAHWISHKLMSTLKKKNRERLRISYELFAYHFLYLYRIYLHGQATSSIRVLIFFFNWGDRNIFRKTDFYKKTRLPVTRWVTNTINDQFDRNAILTVYM